MDKHINDRFVADPNIRGPGWNLKKSNCAMKNQQNGLATRKIMMIVNGCCKKSWIDTPKYLEENVSSFINLKINIVTFACYSTKKARLDARHLNSIYLPSMNGWRLRC